MSDNTEKIDDIWEMISQIDAARAEWTVNHSLLDSVVKSVADAIWADLTKLFHQGATLEDFSEAIEIACQAPNSQTRRVLEMRCYICFEWKSRKI